DNIDALPLSVDADVFYIIRTSHYKKRERRVCAAENIVYPAFVKKDSTGNYVNIKEREDLLTYFLQEIFRKASFRPGQLPILSHSLADKTTIGLLPTGGGKSLTYQLSCILQPGVSIIVDPLVSLMVDQVRGLRDIRIDSCEAVHSGLATDEKRKKLALLQQGASLFMLLSPERFMMENFRDSLITMTEKNHVYFSYGVIDEVHCVSEWGHDFRTSYLHLGRNMINYMKTKSKRPLSVMGLTATASFDVLADVERELTLGGNLSIDSETIVRPENDTRPELSYRIYKVNPSFDELKDPLEQYKLRCESDWDLKDVVAETKKRTLVDMFATIPSDIEAVNDAEAPCYIEHFNAEDFYSPDSEYKYQNAGILFCPHARGTFGVLTNVWNTRPGISNHLIENVGQLNVGTFVGGDRPSGDMKRFNENEQNLMVATKAFGMGIDKPNVRYTINFNHPSSIESFVQEAGRGGRDRKHAISYILFDNSQYIHLTADKVNDIRYYMGQENDPQWLHHYIHRFVLLEDFPELCRANNATEEQITSLLNIIHNHGFLENVDKNIVLYFHNKSFKGLYKEKVILSELTDRIMNVSPSYITEVQGRLREVTGNTDVCLKVDTRRNAVKIFSEEENQDQYG
ncbi:MAG: ATP-dependent DNA helicase RecQ, partial [Bacteroidaceae bacterium]|nr:ATP-dependent DNA helicase RecQ [Bacteroidaceae bacterium]